MDMVTHQPHDLARNDVATADEAANVLPGVKMAL
jgi:hypothetical protein